MKVLITGSGGQVATAMVRNKPPDVDIIPLSRLQLDITDRNDVVRCVSKLLPEVMVNTAAYTAVDRAENEKDLVFRVNADAAAFLASAAKDVGARLIHISTDFVFDGNQSRPYKPSDAPHPLNVYGASKLAGEQKITGILGTSAVILRTSWVYSSIGNNFVNSMLHKMRKRQKLQVVSDQVGSPTWATSLAFAIWSLIANPTVGGVNHWSDAGVASWYDFAVAIAEEAYALGLLQYQEYPISIASSEYPTAAMRPAYSVLDRHKMESACKIRPPHWRVNLRSMLKELAYG